MKSVITSHVLHSTLHTHCVALPTNIRMGWESLQGTNTLVYKEHLTVTGTNYSFKKLAPGANAIKLFTVVS